MNPKQLNEDETYLTDKTIYVQCFDLVTKKWWNEAKIFNENISKDGIVAYLFPGPFHTKFGLIHVGETDVFLYDFKHNRFNIFLSEKSAQIHGRFTPQKERLFYAKDSTLFFFDPQNGLIDSISFGERDFVDTGIPIYMGINKTALLLDNPYPLIIIILAILSGLIFLILFKRNKKLKHKVEFLMNSYLISGKKGNGEITVANQESFRENLTEVEKGLLDIIVSNTSVDTMTTITQVNQVLGISNKSLKIQNNIRAATIQIINKKFMVYTSSNDDLIERQRTEFDKRFFEYFIQRKYLGKVK